VLLTIEEYRKITDKRENILELLATPGVAEIEFEPPLLSDNFHRPVDLS
jgi:hypothetical protein